MAVRDERRYVGIDCLIETLQVPSGGDKTAKSSDPIFDVYRLNRMPRAPKGKVFLSN